MLYIQSVVRYGGAPESLYRLVTHLEGYHPLVVTSGEGELTRRLKNAEIDYFLVKMGMWRKVKSWSRFPFTFYRLLLRSKREKVALIHCNTLWDTPYGVVLGKLLGVPVITHIRNTFEQDKIEKYWLTKASLVVAVSQAVAWPLEETGIPCQVVYNGVDLEMFDRRKVSGEEVRRELGLEGKRVILLPGRVDTTKGQMEAVRAMERIVRDVPEALLLVVGETSHQEAYLLDELKGLVGKSGLEEHIVFTGPREDLPAVIAASEVVIMPSLKSAREGFGRVLIEAMAMGKATVATRTGGIPEVVEEGVTGLLVPPGDASALARATLDLLRDKRKREEMGEAGYRRVLEVFNLKETVTRIEDIYDQFLFT